MKEMELEISLQSATNSHLSKYNRNEEVCYSCFLNHLPHSSIYVTNNNLWLRSEIEINRWNAFLEKLFNRDKLFL